MEESEATGDSCSHLSRPTVRYHFPRKSPVWPSVNQFVANLLRSMVSACADLRMGAAGCWCIHVAYENGQKTWKKCGR